MNRPGPRVRGTGMTDSESAGPDGTKTRSREQSAAEGEIDTQGVAGGDQCRVCIVGPSSRVELVVPSRVPIIELMPTLLGHLDIGLATTGLAHDGWVLQRIGEEPIDEQLGTSAADVYDGEVLYLRPRDNQLEHARYDDLVDGVHADLRGRTDTWSSTTTRRAARVGVVSAALLAIVLVPATGGLALPVWGGLLVVLLASGIITWRLLDERAGSLLVGCGVLAGALGGGAMTLAFVDPTAEGLVVALLVSAAAAGATALGGAYACGGSHPWLAACTSAAAIVVVALLPTVLLGLDGAAAAAVLVTVGLFSARSIPGFSAWSSGIMVEPVPTTVEEFQEGLEAVDAGEIVARSTEVDRYVTAMWWVWAIVVATSLVVLSVQSVLSASVLVGVVVVATLLQARELAGTWHRVAVLGTAVVGFVSLAVHLALANGPVGALVLVVLAIAIAGNGVAAVLVLPGKRLAPRWGHWGDILHWLCALATPALALSVAGLFTWIAQLI